MYAIYSFNSLLQIAYHISILTSQTYLLVVTLRSWKTKKWSKFHFKETNWETKAMALNLRFGGDFRQMNNWEQIISFVSQSGIFWRHSNEPRWKWQAASPNLYWTGLDHGTDQGPDQITHRKKARGAYHFTSQLLSLFLQYHDTYYFSFIQCHLAQAREEAGWGVRLF